MSDTPPPISDEDLSALIGAATAITDPVPELTSEAARGLLRWRSDTANLATLGMEEPAPARSDGPVSITYRVSIESMDVEFFVDGLSVIGTIDGWVDGSVWLQTTETTVEVPVDKHGDFEASAEAPGPARLVVGVGGQRTNTEWFLLIPDGNS